MSYLWAAAVIVNVAATLGVGPGVTIQLGKESKEVTRSIIPPLPTSGIRNIMTSWDFEQFHQTFVQVIIPLFWTNLQHGRVFHWCGCIAASYPSHCIGCPSSCRETKPLSCSNGWCAARFRLSRISGFLGPLIFWLSLLAFVGFFAFVGFSCRICWLFVRSIGLAVPRFVAQNLGTAGWKLNRNPARRHDT